MAFRYYHSGWILSRICGRYSRGIKQLGQVVYKTSGLYIAALISSCAKSLIFVDNLENWVQTRRLYSHGNRQKRLASPRGCWILYNLELRG